MYMYMHIIISPLQRSLWEAASKPSLVPPPLFSVCVCVCVRGGGEYKLKV